MKRLWRSLALLILLAGLAGPASGQGPQPPGQASVPADVTTGTADGRGMALPTATVAPWPGPDGFGTRGESVAYSWVDISLTGTAITFSNGTLDDGYSDALDIGFPFPFYGTDQSQFYASTNGFISFGGGSSAFGNQCPLPSLVPPDGLVAMVWDDTDFTNGGSAYYQTFATCPAGPALPCLVIEYLDMPYYSGGTATVEALLYAGGEIRLQFQHLAQGGASSTTGIEGNNAPAGHGLTYTCNTAGSVPDNSAVRFFIPPFIRIDPRTQRLPAAPCDSLFSRLVAVNHSGVQDTFQMSYQAIGPGRVTGPATVGPLADGVSAPFTVSIVVDDCAPLDAVLTVTVGALAPAAGLTATATVVKDVAGVLWTWHAENADLGTLPATIWGMGDGIAGGDNPNTMRWWVAGGVIDGIRTGQTWYYDWAARAWMEGGTMPQAVYRHEGDVQNGDFYNVGGAIGGFNAQDYNQHESAGSWSLAAPASIHSMDNVAEVWPIDVGGNGHTYLVGGYTGSGAVTATYEYDPLADTWTMRATNPFTPTSHPNDGCFGWADVARTDPVILVFPDGGGTPNVTQLQVYHIASDTWEQWPAPAGFPAAGIWSPDVAADYERNLCYLTGGATAPGGGDLATFYVYDPATNTVRRGPDFASARDFHASFYANDMLCVAGGVNVAGTALASTQCATISVGQACVDVAAWKVAPPTANHGQAITYTVVVSATAWGPGMVAVDILPPNVEFAGHLTWTYPEVGSAWYDPAMRSVTWAVGHGADQAGPARAGRQPRGVPGAPMPVPDSSFHREDSSPAAITVTFAVTVTGICTETVVNVGTAACGVSHSIFAAPTTIVGPLPEAAFHHAVDGCQVILDNTSAYADSFLWDLGDGSTATETNPVHFYLADGSYEVALLAANSCGEDTATATVVLTDCCEPVLGVDFTWEPLTPTAGTIITFTGSAAGGTDVLYTWDLGDGSTSTLLGPTHTYTRTGAFTVTLIASNGCSTVQARQALVVYPSPEASFAYKPPSGNVPLTVQFTDTSQHATGPAWDFGDGGTSTATNPLHTYVAAGDYTVTLAVQSAYGRGTDATSAPVHVAPPDAPLAGFVCSSLTCLGGSTSFTNTTTGYGATYLWSFGDRITSTQVSPSHVYADPGSFTVILTATNAGGTDRVGRDVVVVAAPGGAGLTWSPLTPTVGTTVYLTASVTAGTSPGFAWSFGDGVTGSGAVATHVYSRAGAFAVTVLVSNACGREEAARYITVRPAVVRYAIYLPLVEIPSR